MIDCYTAGTPNGRRVTIMLELCGLSYRRHDVRLAEGEHLSDGFAKINPARAIPVLVDSDGPDGASLHLAQSPAICLYLAEKTGRLIPAERGRRWQAMQYFSQAVTDLGDVAGFVFRCNALGEGGSETCRAFQERFVKGVALVEKRLERRDFLAEELSIADVALLPVFLSETVRPLLSRAPIANIEAWMRRMLAIDAVQRGL